MVGGLGLDTGLQFLPLLQEGLEAASQDWRSPKGILGLQEPAGSVVGYVCLTDYEWCLL